MTTFRLVLFNLILALTGVTAIPQGSPIAQQAATAPGAITSPMPNAALQGLVAIQGSTAIDNFHNWSLEFAYVGDPTDTWFLISESDQPVDDGTLAEWDTTTITDGDYILRLTTQPADGEAIASSVSVRVRNYTPIETTTPGPTTVPTATPLGNADRSVFSDTTPTPLPTNPAELTPQSLASGIKTGIMIVIGSFVLIGFYVYLRGIFRR